MTYEEAESILDVYSLADILERNNYSEADLLCFLVSQEFVELPEVIPLNYA